MKKESWNPEKKGCQLSYSTETLFGMFSSDNLYHKKWLSSKGEGDGSRGYTRKVLRCMRHSGGLSVSGWHYFKFALMTSAMALTPSTIFSSGMQE